MTPNLKQVLFSLILKTLVLSQIQDCICQLNPQYETCAAPFQCGKIGTMKYPFWGNDRSLSCGHPGFELDCRNSVPLITIASIPYRVLDINNETYSLKVAREDVWNNTCHGTLPNTTLDFNIFSFSSTSNDLNISLSYGCSDVHSSLPQPPSSSQTPVDNRFGCKRYGWYMVSTPEEAADTMKAFNCFSSILVPLNQTAASILATPFMSIAAMEDAFGSGFLIQWSANNSNCHDCEESGGVCGYNQDSLSFVCYCSDRTYPLTCNGNGSGSSHALSNMKGLLIGVLVSVVGIVALFMLMLYIRRRLHSRCENCSEPYQNVENFLLNHGSLSPKRYSYYEIKKITHSFSDKLGQGGYGSVYKGMLPKPDGRLVAVKLLTKLCMGDGEEFVNEVSSISRTSHINIVNLLGYCYERNKGALVYEFMPNKSLDKFIYDDISLSKLGWERMYKIAIGVARGLQYLHTGCNTRIVHFDIKPQNILLDEAFCPKISDFGLAKLCGKKQSILSMLGTRGTIGYIAPEVFSRNFGGVSHKSDVYSYGMLVLEMAGSRNIVGVGPTQSTESYFPDEIYKHVTLQKALNLDDVEIADDEEITMKMLLVALWCIQTVPSDRPSISKVVEMLEGSLKHIQIPPKPLLSTPEPSRPESFSLESLNLEREDSVES